MSAQTKNNAAVAAAGKARAFLAEARAAFNHRRFFVAEELFGKALKILEEVEEDGTNKNS